MRGFLQRRGKDIRGQLGQNGEILRWVCESGHGYRCNYITRGPAIQSQEVAASAFSVCRPSSAKAPISRLPLPFRIARWSGSPAIAGLTARQAQRRSEESRVGKDGVSTCRSWWAPSHQKKTNTPISL